MSCCQIHTPSHDLASPIASCCYAHTDSQSLAWLLKLICITGSYFLQLITASSINGCIYLLTCIPLGLQCRAPHAQPCTCIIAGTHPANTCNFVAQLLHTHTPRSTHTHIFICLQDVSNLY
jgi:hypothetical protein